jgi:hypothetical protein
MPERTDSSKGLADLVVGDGIVVLPKQMWGGPRPIERRQVARITKTQIVDNRGGRWLIRFGSAYGESTTWGCDHIAPYQPEVHDGQIATRSAEIELERMRSWLQNFKWEGRSKEFIELVYAVMTTGKLPGER